ncbi:flagellar protein FlgN [Anaeroselena agilis]|uniref:Flagellar protein FlgN n=1 Tax=Anaeroselena agilis TaxID=3063788 RepID=A0ABU3P5G0_9FIRM|nr:flagellar protein FlgN [Selenomonadales bacterium 4137-cl]
MANWDKLINLLEEMVSLYEAILELSRQKRDILIAVKPQDLEAVTKQEELLILQVGKLEAARGKLVQQLAAAGGVTAQDITLAKMKELAGPEAGVRLDKIAAEFERIMAELAPVNKLNAELIQQALGFINYNINLLTQSSAGPTYAPQGKTPQDNQVRKLVDRKI